MKNSRKSVLPIAERRQIENEMIFRRGNEVVGDQLDALDAMHIADDNPELIRDDKMVLHFKCECSDENCAERIPIRLSEYQKIHADRGSFIVKLQHQVDPIEKVIQVKLDYNVVRKNNSTPEPGDALNITPITNT
ncbi:MAG: hypothetical protein NVS1B7_0620 [Candidatus Saccharimonadales bacterium]